MVNTFKNVKGNWTLDIVGGGPQEEELRQAIADDERFHYWGKLMPTQARHLLSTVDVLLQVSRLEGWGCTVNEALMYGNRVIVSDAVGSRALIEHKESCGQIFHSGDWNALKSCIEREITRGKITDEKRKQIINEFKCIYPKAEADYFLRIVDYYTGKNKLKPTAPWS